jgi:hypothetical protein
MLPVSPAPSSEGPNGTGTAATAASQVRRTRSGCQSCRDSKVKCNEQRPSCQRCARLNRTCDYTPRPRKKYTRKAVDSRPEHVDYLTTCAPLPQPDGTEASSTHSSASPHSTVSNLVVATETTHYDPQLELELELEPECASIILPQDFIAIRHFRSSASAALDDTKSPESSGPALVWTLARRNPMVLHMVCALGDRNLRLQDSLTSPHSHLHPSMALEHYAAALNLLATCTQIPPASADLEYILATLWLMILYEQKHGDGCGTGLFAHLRGAATLLQDHLRSLPSILQNDQFKFPLFLTGEETSSSDSPHGFRLSSLTARIICWMAMVDSGAALHGLGGSLNELLGEALSGMFEDKAMCRLRGLSALQSHSTSVCHDIWGVDYPSSQVIEDLQNSASFCLHAELSQLRFLLARLCIAHGEAETSERQRHFVFALRDIQMRYGSLLITNMQVSVLDGAQQRFLMTLRFILPFYFAAVLAFYRLTMGAKPMDCGQRNCIREILTLALQAHDNEGEAAMGRIAWPLFIAALETDDMIHRTWIMERFSSLSARGENYSRARAALQIALSEQRPGERRIGFWELVRRDDIHKFVL